MSAPTEQPKIYHITHFKNLEGILSKGGLMADSLCDEKKVEYKNVGMLNVKGARLTKEVTCHPGTMIGAYVPFYFCPRSIMLYIIHRANHPALSYRGGQRVILHMQADLHRTIEWAENQERRWAFSDMNARTTYASFFNNLEDLGEVDWNAVDNRDFTDPGVHDRKQAEFLLEEFFPWELVEEIGAISTKGCEAVNRMIRSESHKPRVAERREWYY